MGDFMDKDYPRRLAENSINEKTYYYWLCHVRRKMHSHMQQELPALTNTDVPAVAFAEILVLVFLFEG